MADTVDLIIKSATTFYNQLKADQNGRYRSWEHCYKCFHDARNDSNADYDYLSLQLAFYLASWGMYRGSSFLLESNKNIHLNFEGGNLSSDAGLLLIANYWRSVFPDLKNLY